MAHSMGCAPSEDVSALHALASLIPIHGPSGAEAGGAYLWLCDELPGCVHDLGPDRQAACGSEHSLRSCGAGHGAKPWGPGKRPVGAEYQATSCKVLLSTGRTEYNRLLY